MRGASTTNTPIYPAEYKASTNTVKTSLSAVDRQMAAVFTWINRRLHILTPEHPLCHQRPWGQCPRTLDVDVGV